MGEHSWVITKDCKIVVTHLRLFHRNSTRSSHAVIALADGPLPCHGYKTSHSHRKNLNKVDL